MKNEIERSNTPLTFNWVEDSEHHHSQSKRPANRPSMVYYGPLTSEFVRYQQHKDAPNSVPKSSKNSATVEDEPKTTVRTLPSVAQLMIVITTVTLAFVVTIPFGVLGFFLIESSIRRLRDAFYSLRMMSVANAASAETVIILNQTSSSIATPISASILKYAKMAIWPFVLFIPSFFLFSHLIVGMTSENQSRDRKKMIWKVLLALVSLYAFMETMLAMAYSGKWTLLGITSIFPLLMMIVAKLSIASADRYDMDMISQCGNHTVAAATIDPEESIAGKPILLTSTMMYSFLRTFQLIAILLSTQYSPDTSSGCVCNCFSDILSYNCIQLHTRRTQIDEQEKARNSPFCGTTSFCRTINQ